mmetsp:Transcript_29706/g.71538  ORF Transcript_29706/g.71538 Transcript_29706/m.71538 type:complete len:200 (-) Transcript_29706:253-852(-)
MIIGRNAHIGWVFVISHNRQRKQSFILCNMSHHQSFIFPFDLSFPKGSIQSPDSILILGHNNQSRSIHTQSMNDHVIRRRQVNLVAQSFIDGLCKRWIELVLAGHCKDATGLVHYNNILVFVDNLQFLFFQKGRCLVLHAHLLQLGVSSCVDFFSGQRSHMVGKFISTGFVPFLQTNLDIVLFLLCSRCRRIFYVDCCI